MIKRLINLLVIAIIVHGGLFAIYGFLLAPAASNLPEMLEKILFLFFVAPALCLAAPFDSLLWKLELMNSPGWFSWPKPLGFVLVYCFWLLVLITLRFLLLRDPKITRN